MVASSALNVGQGYLNDCSAHSCTPIRVTHTMYAHIHCTCKCTCTCTCTCMSRVDISSLGTFSWAIKSHIVNSTKKHTHTPRVIVYMRCICMHLHVNVHVRSVQTYRLCRLIGGVLAPLPPPLPLSGTTWTS